jgi:hypothetical protein
VSEIFDLLDPNLLPYLLQNHNFVGHLWFMSVILATQEAEIRRIAV